MAASPRDGGAMARSCFTSLPMAAWWQRRCDSVHRSNSVRRFALFRFVDPQQGPSARPNYDVTSDGQRFIVSSIERRTDPSLHVLLNWPALLQKPN